MSEEKIEKGEQTPIMDERIYNQHNWWVVTLVVASFWLFVGVIGFNGLLFTPFYTNTTTIYNWTHGLPVLDIMPAKWTWLVWAPIYVAQFIWLVYGLFTLFRKTTNGSYLYLKPDFMCWGIYVAIIVNYLANIGWCFTYWHIPWGLFFCLVMTFSMHVFLFISCRKLFENQSELEQFGFKNDIWFVRVLIHNGCAMYGAWVSLASIMYFGLFLTVHAQVEAMRVSTFCLCIILFATIKHFIFDNFIWRNYMRYMYAPYFVVIWFLVGSFTANLTAGNMSRNSMFTMIVLIIVICLLVARFVLNFFYKTKYPEGFNFNKLIKVNKIFKNSRSGSEPEADQQSEQP